MNVVLGVCGSVAAYRAADLARALMRDGHTVRVCLTDSGAKFVTPALFEALTGQPCLQDAFDEPEKGRMAHIEWARQADAIVVAPATANTIAKLAYGIADDMLTTLVVASRAPLVVAPAMNPYMFANEAHQEALAILSRRAVDVVEPETGVVACGEEGKGRFASIERITSTVRTVLSRSQKLSGRRVLITSGPTQEPIDDVRYITNRSSGKMGAALARAAQLMGAQVRVIAGPQTASLPIDCHMIRVTTAQEMLEAALQASGDADLIVGAAAVADYHIAQPVKGKLRRSKEPIQIELTPNEDIIAAVAAKHPTKRIIGFAAEPTADLEVARQKLKRKGLYAIAANDVSRTDIGFETDQNELWLVRSDGDALNSGLLSKLGCALWLFDAVAD